VPAEGAGLLDNASELSYSDDKLSLSSASTMGGDAATALLRAAFMKDEYRGEWVDVYWGGCLVRLAPILALEASEWLQQWRICAAPNHPLNPHARNCASLLVLPAGDGVKPYFAEALVGSASRKVEELDDAAAAVGEGEGVVALTQQPGATCCCWAGNSS
jgi:hypothetical protein